jgi:hypothetical protein
MKTLISGAVLVFGLALGAGGAVAQDDGLVAAETAELVVPGGEQEWGTASDVIASYTAHDFDLVGGSETAWNSSLFGRVCGVGLCNWVAGLSVPTGAQIGRIEISACDGSTTGAVDFSVFRLPRVPGAAAPVSAAATTGTAGTPGCSTFTHNLPISYTVQNGANAYAMKVEASAGTNMTWTSVRVFYRLQVSPPPATASFPIDVPTTSPYFRFVEAMAASGLTGGCASGRFCPDSPVTRGQLAVFLASALGLHFPN